MFSCFLLKLKPPCWGLFIQGARAKMRLNLKDSSDNIFEPMTIPMVPFKKKLNLGRIQNWPWLVCSLFNFRENDQNVRSTMKVPRAHELPGLGQQEGLWGLQVSQQALNQITKSLISKKRYPSELVSAYKGLLSYQDLGFKC